MRIVVADCSVIYTGRGDTRLPRAVRAIIVKDDGSISVHNDKSNKPLNYMGKGNELSEVEFEDYKLWFFDTRQESLRITLHEVISDTDFLLDRNDEGLIRDGTEKQLQAWLAENPEALGEGYTFVQREYQTGAGAVDLLVTDPEGNPVAVEVKRVAMINSVSQTQRYVESMKEDPEFAQTTGIIAALDIRPNTVKLADKKKIRCVTLPTWWRDPADTSM
jgi:RecB family endonuclease NucS